MSRTAVAAAAAGDCGCCCCCCAAAARRCCAAACAATVAAAVAGGFGCIDASSGDDADCARSGLGLTGAASEFGFQRRFTR